MNVLGTHSTAMSRTKYKSGTSFGDRNVKELTESHPFIQQIDVVFPSNEALATSLKSATESYTYHRFSFPLAPFVTMIIQQKLCGRVTALSCSPELENSWCLDPRGVLTLILSKDMYELCGLSGQQLPFKHKMKDRYHVSLPLTSESSANARKRETALKAWDQRMHQEGVAPWEILCSSDIADIRGRPHMVKAKEVNFHNTIIPKVGLNQPEHSTPHELFEWIGMACIGSQRLQAFDSPDPYVSLYTPPEPSFVGDLTYLCWVGFITPAFTAKVLQACLGSLSTQVIGFTAHGFTGAPIAYLPSNNKLAPLRYPLSEADGEDTWSLIMFKGSWMLAESIGRWDARWG